MTIHSGKLLNSAFLWRCLFFNFTHCVILEHLSILSVKLLRPFDKIGNLEIHGLPDNKEIFSSFPKNDTGFGFERNCVLRRWESETLK